MNEAEDREAVLTHYFQFQKMLYTLVMQSEQSAVGREAVLTHYLRPVDSRTCRDNRHEIEDREAVLTHYFQ